jgi:hypothetical protein
MREEFQKNGLNFDRGVRQADFMRASEKAFEAIRERFRGGGGPGAPGGPPGGFGPGGGPPQQGGDPRRMDDRSRSGGPPPSSDDRSRSDSRSSSDNRDSRDSRSSTDARNTSDAERRDERGRRGSEPAQPTRIFLKQERVTVDLPATFVEGDKDGDGQLSFAEWRQWRPTQLADFLRMDADGDGFLTPKEIKFGLAASPASSAAPAVAATTGSLRSSSSTPTSTPASAATGPNAATTPVTVTPLTDEEKNSVEGRQATNYVSQLDRNKNGQIDPEEWSISRRIKPQFEQAGVNLSQPMPVDQFIALYVKLNRKG